MRERLFAVCAGVSSGGEATWCHVKCRREMEEINLDKFRCWFAVFREIRSNSNVRWWFFGVGGNPGLYFLPARTVEFVDFGLWRLAGFCASGGIQLS